MSKTTTKAPTKNEKAKATTKAKPTAKENANVVTERAKPTDKTGSLRKPQLRILGVLASAKRGLTRSEIIEKAGENPSRLDSAWMCTWVGPTDPAKRRESDEKYKLKSLLTLGFVRIAPSETEAVGTPYEITAAGKKAYIEFKSALKS